jgi:hypothetical protein
MAEETKKLNRAILDSVSIKEKNKVLIFVTFEGKQVSISDFLDGKASKDAKQKEIYDVEYTEKWKEGRNFPFKNLFSMTVSEDVDFLETTEKGENIKDEPIGNANRIKQPAMKVQSKDEYFQNKDIVIAKQSCLRDACMIAEIQANLKQITKVDLPYIYILANDMLKNMYPEAEGFE